jgi:uncharacterized protein YkwD
MLLIGGALATGPLQADTTQPDLSTAERLVIATTNEFRAGQRLAPTKPDPKLAAAARDFAAYMARTDRYGHEADGRSPPDRAHAHGYAYCTVAENIAFLQNAAGYSSEALASGAFDGWKQSPQHRRNMLEPEVDDTAGRVRTKPDLAALLRGSVVRPAALGDGEVQHRQRDRSAAALSDRRPIV